MTPEELAQEIIDSLTDEITEAVKRGMTERLGIVTKLAQTYADEVEENFQCEDCPSWELKAEQAEDRAGELEAKLAAVRARCDEGRHAPDAGGVFCAACGRPLSLLIP